MRQRVRGGPAAMRSALAGIGLAALTLATEVAAEPEAPSSNGAAGHGAAPREVAPPPPSPELLVPPTRAQASASFHPPVVLRDSSGARVIDSGGALSTLQTCGACHDAQWIGEHGYHFTLGVHEQTELGKTGSGRAWDFGPGLFGRWQPWAPDALLRPEALHRPREVDQWLQQVAPLLLGGGPAALGDRAGALEPNCVACHVRGADLERTAASIARGDFAGAATASLEPLGLVERAGGEDAAGLVWKRSLFEADGSVPPSRLRIAAPTSETCGTCHGVVSRTGPTLEAWRRQMGRASATGTVFSPSRVSDSVMNVARRTRLARPWDVHAERLLQCSDCHFSPNDPGAALANAELGPGYLRYDARHSSFGDFLRRPNHDFAKGSSAQGTVAQAQDGTLPGCEGCHDARPAHKWFPSADQHLSRVACEACHIERVLGPARSVTDLSMPRAPGVPREEYRGLEGAITDPTSYVTGYEPLLLLRRQGRGAGRLYPNNVVTSWFWVVDDADGPRPAPEALLDRAFFVRGRHKPELVAALDANRDGRLDDPELALDTPNKVELARRLLVAAGAKSPRIEGEMQPYGLHHGIAPARFALHDCDVCHSSRSRISAGFELARRGPYGATPRLVGDANVLWEVGLETSTQAGWRAVPAAQAGALHVFGLSRVRAVDALGLLAVFLTLIGALGHGALRLRSARRRTTRGQSTPSNGVRPRTEETPA
ncbi:MAG: hypothetical protein JW940_02200 [Polyangiaceae bacterium]|nr:hypothetical protein [Polyangiaceae bacterium]